MSKIKQYDRDSKLVTAIVKYYEDKKYENKQYSHVIVNLIEKRFLDKDGNIDREYMLYHYNILKKNMVTMVGFYGDLTHLDINDPEVDKEVVYELITFIRMIDHLIKIEHEFVMEDF